MAKRRIVGLILMVAMACGVSGCKVGNQATDNSGKVNIICTVFPVYDWVNEIVGENPDKFNITLLSSGGDLHSYQPSAADIAAIHTSDLFVYVGGESDKWAEKILKEKSLNAIRLFDVNKGDLLDLGDGHDHDHEDDGVYDEHIWLSLRLAERTVDALCTGVSELDAENAEAYRSNADGYIHKLKMLDAEYKKAVEESDDRTVIFADRFPYIYMTEDYGIEYYAAFPGCSSDTHASFETVARLSEKVTKLKKDTLLVLENSNQTVADAVIGASGRAGVKVAVMNSCQTIGATDADKEDYIDIMKENLEALKGALE